MAFAGPLAQHIDDHRGRLLDRAMAGVDDRPAAPNEQAPRFEHLLAQGIEVSVVGVGFVL